MILDFLRGFAAVSNLRVLYNNVRATAEETGVDCLAILKKRLLIERYSEIYVEFAIVHNSDRNSTTPLHRASRVKMHKTSIQASLKNSIFLETR